MVSVLGICLYSVARGTYVAHLKQSTSELKILTHRCDISRLGSLRIVSRCGFLGSGWTFISASLVLVKFL